MPGLYFDSGINKGFDNDIDRMKQKVNSLSDTVSKKGQSMESSFAKIGKGLAVYFGASQLIAFGKAVINTRAEFQKFGIILENTLGSKVEADNALAMVSKFAAETPFALTEVTDSFIKLTNQGFQPTYTELIKLGDLASSTGKSFNQLSEAILDAQTGEFERLKEFGIKARKEGDQITFTFKGQQVVVDNTAESIREYVLGLGDMEGVAGANAKIAQSLTGQISNMGDAWDQVLNQLGELIEVPVSKALSAISGGLSELSEKLKILNDDESTTLEKTEAWYDIFSYILPILGNIKDTISGLTVEFKKLFGLDLGNAKVLTKREDKVVKGRKPKKAPILDPKAEEKARKERQKQYEKSLDDFEKYVNTQKDTYEQFTKDVDELSGERKQVIVGEYSELLSKGENYLEFLNRLLLAEKDKNKRAIISKEIAEAQLLSTVAGQKAAEEELDKQNELFNKLLSDYQTYTQKRQDIENKYYGDIDKLRAAGYEDQAKQAEAALEVELLNLDEAIVSSNLKFKQWLDETLPGIADKGVKALQEELDRLSIALKTEGLSPEDVLVYQAEIKKLTKLLHDKVKPEKTSEQSWKDTLEVMNGVNELVGNLLGSFEGLSDSTKSILSGVTEVTGGVINMVTAFKAVATATSALEKASAILAVISIGIKIITTIVRVFKDAAEERKLAHINELEKIQAINLALIEQNRLYAEGNELFADDKWGTALKGLDAFNQALQAQNNIYNEIVQSEQKALSKYGFDVDIPKTIEGALGSISVKTRNRSGFANFFGFQDEYANLLTLYPNVIKANGDLDAAVLKTIVDTATLSDVDKVRLENLLEVVSESEKAFAQFGDYISSIFGGIGDDITDAFQLMYETGSDAMTDLEGSFSDMIEKFTQDAIEFAFLQPYLEQLNQVTKDLGTQYAKGGITADALQTGVVDSLGQFYAELGTLQPQILDAYRRADELAAAAGFTSAFNAPTDSTTQEPIIVEDVATPTSTAGRIEQTITQEEGSIISGRLGAIALSNEVLSKNSGDALEYAIQNLVYMKAIKLNTDYLPEIAENTRKTYQKLESI